MQACKTHTSTASYSRYICSISSLCLFVGAGSTLAIAFATDYPLTGSFSVNTTFNPSVANVTDALIAGGAMIEVASLKAPSGVISGEIYPTIPPSALNK